MITIIYSTHKDSEYNNKFRQHLLQTVGLKDVQILEYVNHNEHSLSKLYNKGISESIYNIVVCCHNDIKLEKNWGKKLLLDFISNDDYGIIGKAGSCYFPESGVYWEKMGQTMVGQVYHHPEGSKKWVNNYSAKLPYLIPVVTIDGLFISFDKTKIKHNFDETIGKFHFYDHSFCLPNYLDGVKIGVTSSFEITHQSVGQPNQEFFDSKIKFLEKWKHKLPLDLKPTKIYVPEIKEKPLKNIGKVAIIIPTKGKVNLLFDCVSSFYEHCNKDLFDIFIADTGSSDSEKEWIKNKILPFGNIKLLEYNYYNFAKINNDVVKNHITKDYEFVLFCNNDIKILNNVLYGMLKIFKDNPITGTVGCRLHFEDNTVQHDGIVTFVDKNQSLLFSHLNLRSYYSYTLHTKKLVGSTGALLMIRKSVFEKCDFFNENYTSCFEDVELNLKCILLGYNNYYDGSLVSYHYESQTRNEDPEIRNKLTQDYQKNLLPFVVKHLDKLKNYIIVR
jgi:GT2 family glycosyltransferase